MGLIFQLGMIVLCFIITAMIPLGLVNVIGYFFTFTFVYGLINYLFGNEESSGDSKDDNKKG